MALYGLYVRNVDEADFQWFTTEEVLAPGSYVLGRHSAEPNVHVADSIPGLIMMVGPIIQKAEDEGRDALASPGISAEDRQRLEEKHTQGLMSQLTETSSIWESSPKWLRRLNPA